MAGKEHGKVQARLAYLILLHYADKFAPISELTTRVKETKFFVPDVAVEDLSHPIKGRYPGPGDPVFLCVEIKSPDDRLTKLFAKCDEYHSWGVPFCWIIEPDRRLAWEYFPNDYEPRKVGEALSAGPIQIPLAAIFESL